MKNSLEVKNSGIKQTQMTSVNGYRGDDCQTHAYAEKTKSSESKRTSRLVRNLKLTGGPGEEQNTESRMRRTGRRSKPRRIRRSNDLQRETSSRRKSSRTSLHEDKSMLKHIMKTCKVVNYVDTETSSGTQISSRRSSRTTPARLHRACTVERLNSNIEELTKHNTADLFTKH